MLLDACRSGKVVVRKAGVGAAGFDELVIAQIVPTCFKSILKVDFDPDDAWVSAALLAKSAYENPSKPIDPASPQPPVPLPPPSPQCAGPGPGAQCDTAPPLHRTSLT